jgi:hypothetical protein
VAWARAADCNGRGTLGELSCLFVDLVDADQVGAEISDEQEVAGWVDECMVRVRYVLTIGVCAGTFERPLECLERLLAVEWEFVRRQLGSLAGLWSVIAVEGVQWTCCSTY